MKKILLIGHDANRAGAQLVLLQMLQMLKQRNIPAHLLLCDSGPLENEYRQLTSVSLWPQPVNRLFGRRIDKLLYLLRIGQWLHRREEQRRWQAFEDELRSQDIGLVMVNTVTSSKGYRPIYELVRTLPVILFVHELEMAVRMYTRPDTLRFMMEHTDHLIAVSKAVARYYEETFGFDASQISTFQLIDIPSLLQKIEHARQLPDVLAKHGIPENAIIVGGCGNAEWRKGNDLFNVIARQVIDRFSDLPVYFVWVGMPHNSLSEDLELDLKKAGLSDRVLLIEPTPEVFRYTTRFDIFALCSREDPYPLVVLEAALSETPVVCFERAGGAPELVETDGGFVVPYLDTVAMADRIATLIDDKAMRRAMGQELRRKVIQRHSSEQSMDSFLSIVDQLTATTT
ncbi:glycosyltransferase family 4 protein [Larkinella terrae]|uniref:Glycosyltransferase n=1 Tax=Larkinella terrae TaxID=2025311 RepID=A0A7K0EUF5_9BACT|nr:glycosyltransferase family 4 protein [Larkinella terrae]MRS65389.1 glycosyltransferase [Larkinella terrae]